MTARRIAFGLALCLLTSVLVVLPGTPAGAVAVDWTASAVGVTGRANRSISADIDSDGDLDLVVTFDTGLVYFENDGTGATWPERRISLTTFLDGAAVGDLDGDGDLDVVANDSDQEDLIVFLNDGTPANGAWNQATIDSDAVDALTMPIADVDGDGDADIVSAYGFGPNQGDVKWYENVNGNATLWTEHLIASSLGPAFHVVVFDADGDGELDVAATDTSGQLDLYRNNGTPAAGLWPPTTIMTGFSGRALTAGDVDGDGDGDLVVVLDNQVLLLTNAGDGTGWASTVIDAGVANDLALVDTDADGDLDVVGAIPFDDAIVRYENLGDGATWAETQIASVDLVWAVSPGDIDGDGDLDISYTSAGTADVGWAENQTIHATSFWGSESVVGPFDVGITSVAAADLDGDGDLDLAAANFGVGAFRWLENDAGDGTAWTSRVVAGAQLGATDLQPADVDGDGDLDLVGISRQDDRVGWFPNDGTADPAFGARVPIATPDGPVAVGVGDLDGDGDLDVVAASELGGGAEVRVHLNTAVTGDGSAWSSTDIHSAVVTAIAVADLDGDGDLDLATTARLGQILVHENNGAGAFAAAHTADGGFTQPTDVAAADIDGDGDLDLASTSAADDLVTWQANDGTPFVGVWARTSVTTGADGPTSIAAADVDLDGDIDLATTSRVDNTVQWSENRLGDGTSWASTDLDVASTLAFSTAFGDVDGDGDPDVVAASETDGTIAWFRNDRFQQQLSGLDTAPVIIAPGGLDDVLTITPTHLGRAGDHASLVDDLALRFERALGTPMTSAEADALIDELRIYADANADNTFDLGDTLAASFTSFTLDGAGDDDFATPGVTTRVPFGGAPRLFVVVRFAADAGDLPTKTLRLSLLTGTSGADADAASTIPVSTRFQGTLTSSIVTAAAAPGGARPTPTVTRRAGPDRYATAAAVNAGLPSGVGVAYVATGEDFADALTAGPVAGIQSAALLLVTRDSIPSATVTELVRLAPRRIVVLGGTAAISEDVARQLASHATEGMDRVAGTDRYGTAAALSARVFPNGAPVVHLVDGHSFADGIAAGPVAGAARGPVLLVDHDHIPTVTAAELVRLDPSQVVLAGGSSAIAPAVAEAVRTTMPAAALVSRAGPDRYATAAALGAPQVHPGTATIFVATGMAFADALTVTPWAVRAGAVVLLVPPDGTLPTRTKAVLDAGAGADIVVVGGTNAVSDTMLRQLR